MTKKAMERIQSNQRRRLINKVKSCLFFLACMAPILMIAFIGGLVNNI